MSIERIEKIIDSDLKKNGRIKVGDWEFSIGPKREIEPRTIGSLEAYLDKYTRAALPYPPITYAERVLEIPSCLVRIDASLETLANGAEIEKGIYEVEARPAGLGVFLTIAQRDNPETVKRFGEVFNQFEGFGGFVTLPSIGPRMEDTRTAAEILKLPFYELDRTPPNDALLWVRGGNEDRQNLGKIFDRLEHQSLCPVSGHGDKNYLLKMGLARLVNSPDKLPWDEGFVIKPLVGSKMDGVAIYLPPNREREYFGKNPPQGLSTRSKVLSLIEKGSRPFIFQKISLPMREIDQYIIARLYFGWKLRENKWKFVGGLWNSRPNLRVHGASDATFGLLY